MAAWTLKAGDAAPDFDLPADGGGRVRLADFKGEAVVLYFYPKDDTPGCTNEAKGFSEAAIGRLQAKAGVDGRRASPRTRSPAMTSSRPSTASAFRSGPTPTAR